MANGLWAFCHIPDSFTSKKLHAVIFYSSNLNIDEIFQFLLFQNFDSVRGLLVWADPELANFHIDMDKVSVHCFIS